MNVPSKPSRFPRRTLLVVTALLWLAFLLPPTTGEARPAPFRLRVPVLIFHHVTWFKSTDNATQRGLTIQPPQFDAEVGFLLAHHYRVLTAAQVIQHLRAHRPLPAHPVVLSFDDGYADMYTNVYPVLRRHHLRATFFICPGLLGKPLGSLPRGYLTWPQVETMARNGMDIEAHTLTHPDLTMVPQAQMRGEIIGSRRVLQAVLHRSVRVFAYPYGDYDADTLRALREAGFEAAFTTHQGYWLSDADPLLLPRLYVNNTDTPTMFADLVGGRCNIALANVACRLRRS
jgi:peptidoglycan/xylan/chitin deacetylase (PgdA/CDA1 family)